MSILDDEEDLMEAADESVFIGEAKKWYIEHSEPYIMYGEENKSDYAITEYFNENENRMKLEMVSTVLLSYYDHKVHIFPRCNRYPIYLKDADKIPDYIVFDTDFILKVKKDGTFDGDFKKFHSEKISRL